MPSNYNCHFNWAIRGVFMMFLILVQSTAMKQGAAENPRGHSEDKILSFLLFLMLYWQKMWWDHQSLQLNMFDEHLFLVCITISSAEKEKDISLNYKAHNELDLVIITASYMIIRL